MRSLLALTSGSLLAAVLASPAHAALSVNDGTPVTVSFDASILGVYRAGTGNVGLAEPNNFNASDGTTPTLVTSSFGVRSENVGLLGFGANTRTPIAADANSDGDADDRSSVIEAGMLVVNTINGQNVFVEDRARFNSFDLTLQVQNNTGGTVSQFTAGLDTYFDNSTANDGASNVTFAYSTDNVTFTQFATRTIDAPGGGVDGFGVEDAATLQTIGSTFNATVANGGFLYLRVAYDRAAGGGGGYTGVGLDNLSVTAVPEPAAAASALLAAAGLLARRRRA